MVEYLKRLGQRKMAQWALAYAAGTWVALQAIGMAASSYGWSPVVMRVALGIAVIGFLATLVLAAHPDLLKANNKLGCQLQIAYLRLEGRHELATATCKSVLEALRQPRFAILPASEDPTELGIRGMAYACLGNKASALSDMVRAGALANTDKQAAPATELALARAQLWLGDDNAAIALLAHSLTVPYGTTVAMLRLDLFWQPLRNDPRFQPLLR